MIYIVSVGVNAKQACTTKKAAEAYARALRYAYDDVRIEKITVDSEPAIPLSVNVRGSVYVGSFGADTITCRVDGEGSNEWKFDSSACALCVLDFTGSVAVNDGETPSQFRRRIKSVSQRKFLEWKAAKQ